MAISIVNQSSLTSNPATIPSTTAGNTIVVVVTEGGQPYIKSSQTLIATGIYPVATENLYDGIALNWTWFGPIDEFGNGNAGNIAPQDLSNVFSIGVFYLEGVPGGITQIQFPASLSSHGGVQAFYFELTPCALDVVACVNNGSIVSNVITYSGLITPTTGASNILFANLAYTYGTVVGAPSVASNWTDLGMDYTKPGDSAHTFHAGVSYLNGVTSAQTYTVIANPHTNTFGYAGTFGTACFRDTSSSPPAFGLLNRYASNATSGTITVPSSTTGNLLVVVTAASTSVDPVGNIDTFIKVNTASGGGSIYYAVSLGANTTITFTASGPGIWIYELAGFTAGTWLLVDNEVGTTTVTTGTWFNSAGESFNNGISLNGGSANCAYFTLRYQPNSPFATDEAAISPGWKTDVMIIGSSSGLGYYSNLYSAWDLTGTQAENNWRNSNPTIPEAGVVFSFTPGATINAQVDQLVREAWASIAVTPPNAVVDQLVRESYVTSSLLSGGPNALVDQMIREAWVSVCDSPSNSYNFLYIKSFPLTSGSLYTVALDAGGVLWSQLVTGGFNVMDTLVTNIIPGSYMLSTTEDDVEYACFSNLLRGTDIPRQYNPQPAVGNFTLDRISQVGPGAPPQFQVTTSVSGGQVNITSWAGVGNIVTFQATNTFTAGEVITLSAFASSTFFNGLQFSVLGTGLSGSQFEVAFSGYSGGTDAGIATPQYGYPIASIVQQGAISFGNQDELQSPGPGLSGAGQTITFYYGAPNAPQNQSLVTAFNAGPACYVYIANAPFANGTQLVTSLGTSTPPGAGAPRPYFTVTATNSVHQQTANSGTFTITSAIITTKSPIPNVSAGDEITISGASPGGWDNTWTVTEALNSGVYAITQTSMSSGVATYSWSFSGGGMAVAPISGQLVTVIQTLNGNGIFNVTDAAVGTVTGGPSSGTFTIAALGTSSQNIPAAPEQGQAQTSGTLFQIDPGSTTLGTTTNPIFGNDSGSGIVSVAGSNTSIGAGTRQAVVFFETRNGFKTACSAPVTFTTEINATYLLADQIPIGPPNVIRRWIAFTTAGPNGIPGPNFYTIDAPVSFTVNNQTFTYTPTYIDDNTSTSAKFTFTDAVLLAGEGIDVLGNNLFNEIELGASAWNVAYAERMFYGLEVNHILNFNNLSFDGGYLPNPNATTFPLGWNVDLTSNQVIPAAATITSWQITAGGALPHLIHSPGQNAAVFQAANNFTVGIFVTITGLTAGASLFNGVTSEVIAATLTQFTIATVGPVTAPTADSGTATPVNVSGQLVPSPIFGDSFYITNQANGVVPILGMITQNAYQDAYNVPIILPNTLYSVEVAASIPSGRTVGSLIIDLTGSNLGLSTGTGSTSNPYGATYGTFTLPFSAMTPNVLLYSGTILTQPFLTGVPVGLLLRVWAQNIGVGNDVLVDRIRIYPTATPLLATNIRVSYADNFEAFDAVTGNLGLAAHNTEPAFGAFEMHDQLYFLQKASMQSTQDVPGIEPSNPGGGWSVHEVSNRVGACGIHAYDYGEEWALMACRNGVFGFNGGQPIRIDFQQREIWELINWNASQSIWLRNDIPNSRILVGVPLPTPNRWLPFAPSNPAPTSPNVMLMWNYQNLNTFEEIVNGRGVHTTMFGTLAAVDMRLKMSIWQITSPYSGFITDSTGSTAPLTICNGQGNQKIYRLSPDQLSDDGSPIYSFYMTFGFVDAAKAKENPLLGLHRKRYQIAQQLIVGSGLATLTAWPNFILNPRTLAINPDIYIDPGGIQLQTNPSDDIVRPLNLGANRMFVSYSTNAVGAAFRLSKAIMVGTIDPVTALNPNAG